MIYPPIFAVCNASPAVQAELGNPCRFYPFGRAENDDGGRPQRPYAVWQVVSGVPENYLGCLPDADNWTLQVDVYAATAKQARDAATALRNAIEPEAYVTAWRGESVDAETRNYRCSFDVDWIDHRDPTSN